MFTGNVMLMPGQELREFTVSRPDTRGTENGREGLTNKFYEVGKVRAILAQAKPEEVQRWRQLNHPITHKIIMQHKAAFEIQPGDIFERDGKRYYHQMSPYNVGDIGHWTIFYCDERGDVK
jgi:hypothetical protein